MPIAPLGAGHAGNAARPVPRAARFPTELWAGRRRLSIAQPPPGEWRRIADRLNRSFASAGPCPAGLFAVRRKIYRLARVVRAASTSGVPTMFSRNHFQRGDQRRKIFFDRPPNNLPVHRHIIVYQLVSYSSHRSPRDFRMAIAHCGRDALRRLAYDLQCPHNCKTSLFVSGELVKRQAAQELDRLS
jgi:hypothetical protein